MTTKTVKVGVHWVETAYYSADVTIEVPADVKEEDLLTVLDDRDEPWFETLMEQNQGQACMCVYCDSVEGRELLEVTEPVQGGGKD